MKSFEDLLETLKNEQPSWQKDGGGIRGFNRQAAEQLTQQQRQPTPFSFEKIKSEAEKTGEIEGARSDLPTSVFYVCVSGQPHIATLYGTIVPMEEE